MPSRTAKELLLFRSKEGVIFLFRDDFITAEAAPLTSPRTAESGPGLVTIVDTEDKFSISGGDLVSAGGKAVPAFGDPGMLCQDDDGNNFVRAIGLVALYKWKSVSDLCIGGWGLEIGTGVNGWFQSGATLSIRDWDTQIDTSAALGDTHNIFIVLRSHLNGFFAIINNTLEWVSIDTNLGTSVAPNYTNHSGVWTSPTVRASQLPAPWDTDDGIATSVLDGARSAGDTFTHEADCLIEYIVTAVPSAGIIQFFFRIQDATNYWEARINSAGDFNLFEVVGGSGIQRASAAGVISNGDRIVIITDDEEIKGYHDNTLDWTFSSAANFKTETSGELDNEGTAGSVSDIKAWPRVISGDALAALNAVAA